jgi:hypothetical protein
VNSRLVAVLAQLSSAMFSRIARNTGMSFRWESPRPFERKAEPQRDHRSAGILRNCKAGFGAADGANKRSSPNMTMQSFRRRQIVSNCCIHEILESPAGPQNTKKSGRGEPGHQGDVH